MQIEFSLEDGNGLWVFIAVIFSLLLAVIWAIAVFFGDWLPDRVLSLINRRK